MVTIKQVSEKAGVSSATVSRVINNTGTVKEKTRELVMAAMAELGYRHNVVAASLASNKTHTIGYVVPELHGSFFGAMMGGTEQALREAKTETYWTTPNETLETSARAYASRLAEHLLPHPEAARPMLEIADRLSVAQCALKLTVPGVPDVYQGCEIANYALTDPDNRRPVDFAVLERALADAEQLPRRLDRAKFELTRTLLHLRRKRAELFLEGSYVPRETDGRICAFAREHGGTTLSVAIALDGSVTTDELEAANLASRTVFDASRRLLVSLHS